MCRHSLDERNSEDFISQIVLANDQLSTAEGRQEAIGALQANRAQRFPFAIVDASKSTRGQEVSLLYDNRQTTEPAWLEFFLDPPSLLLFRRFQGKTQEAVLAEHLYIQTDFAVAQLPKRLPGKVKPLQMAVNNPAVGSPVFVLGFPHGRTPLSVSVGKVLGFKDGILFHNAASAGGSSGSPILNIYGQVVAIHTTSLETGSGSERKVSRGGPAVETIRQSQNCFNALLTAAAKMQADGGKTGFPKSLLTQLKRLMPWRP